MDRREQLSNVAFGGAWSEQIAGEEAISEALLVLKRACEESVDRDIREDAAVRDALEIALEWHPKPLLLRDAWARAASVRYPQSRRAELARAVELIRQGLGV